MTFTLLFIIVALVAECGLWLAIKRFRSMPDGTERISASLFRETVWWLIGTLVVLILLGVLIERVYNRDETQTSQTIVSNRITADG